MSKPGNGHDPDGAPLTLLYSGKVRDVYSWGDDRLLLVASDRVSAYDHVLPTPIPDKGKILTQLSLWWFGQLADLVPNHLIDAEIPAEFDGRAMACRRLSMVPVECVARGYLAGSGLREYRKYGSVCGVPLPAGLTDGSRLPEPIFTPATKAPRGEHDENIPLSTAAALVGADVAAELRADHAGGVPARSGRRRPAAASWWPTPRSSSASIRAGGCCWPTRFSLPTRPGCGLRASGSPAGHKSHSTSRLSETG